MFVSDSNIFPACRMKIRITNMDGIDFIADFNPEMTVDKFKIMSLTHYYDPSESVKSSLYHKVVLVRTGKVLAEDKTLLQQGVLENDELLLLKRRLFPSQFEGPQDKAALAEAKKGPTAEAIKSATAEEPVCNTQTVTGATNTTIDTELRRILISLIEVSQKLLCLNPEASKIFKQAEEILNSTTPQSKLDDNDVKQLTDMGFPENRARKALRLNRMSVMSAFEWLLQHDSDADIDVPLPEDTTEEDGASGGKDESESLNLSDQNQSVAKVSNILKSLRAYRKREFKPNPKALQHLIEMGFEEKDAIDALRIARNDRDAACDWLLGDRKTRPEDVEDGLDVSGPIFKAILSNPTVQLGLNNPRCLLVVVLVSSLFLLAFLYLVQEELMSLTSASCSIHGVEDLVLESHISSFLSFIQMLEHPQTASQWLSDPETAPVLVQVSRIYHAEKNSENAKNCTEKSGQSSAKDER